MPYLFLSENYFKKNLKIKMQIFTLVISLVKLVFFIFQEPTNNFIKN